MNTQTTENDALGFDFAGMDAPTTTTDDRQILGLAIGHRVVCADVRIMGGCRVDIVIDGDAGLGTEAARASIKSALERGTGTWTHGRSWAERMSERVQAGEIWT